VRCTGGVLLLGRDFRGGLDGEEDEVGCGRGM